MIGRRSIIVRGDQGRIAVALLACVVLCACDDGSAGSDEGGTLRGHWSGRIVCEGDLAYTYSFDQPSQGALRAGVRAASRRKVETCCLLR